MTAISKLADHMGSESFDTMNSNVARAGESYTTTDYVNGLQQSNTKSDHVFVVDMERFSHIIEKDHLNNANSRIITRNLSKKGSFRSGAASEKKSNSITTCNGKDTTTSSMFASSPRAITTLHGGSSMPEKPVLVSMGATENSPIPQLVQHHQITINNAGNVSSNTISTIEPSKLSSGKRFSFRRSSSPTSWTIDPRRIVFYFATLSCMGTILLIYFTLSMGKINGDA